MGKTLPTNNNNNNKMITIHMYPLLCIFIEHFVRMKGSGLWSVGIKQAAGICGIYRRVCGKHFVDE